MELVFSPSNPSDPFSRSRSVVFTSGCLGFGDEVGRGSGACELENRIDVVRAMVFFF